MPKAIPLSTQDIDESPELVQGEVLHRRLQDASGQDYFVYWPGSARHGAPVLVAVHDISRDAHEQARGFARLCERHGVVLVAPHFAADRYPNFQRLGRSRHASDKGQYADDALLSILQDVARLTGMAVERVHLFGFGAGGRFVMRYAMAHPERVAGAVIVSPEAFTFPDPDKRYPRGIAPGSKRQDLAFRPVEFLRVPMTLIEGTVRAGDTGSPQRPVRVVRSPAAIPRDKGRTWVAAMRAAAEANHLATMVSYRKAEEALDSFGTFIASGQLADSVFEELGIGARAGLPVMIPAEGVLQRAVDRDVWRTIGPADLGEHLDDPAVIPTRVQRLALPASLLAVGLAILAPLLIWANYRATYVVSRDAVVRSHIADVGARVDGVIREINVDSGDRVKAGEIVARLEDRHFEARVSQARSQLEKAQRKLEVEGLAIENERQRLAGSLREVSAESSAAKAGVLAAESKAAEAARQVELQRSLAARGLVPAERVRTAETELRTAQALVAESRAAASAAGAGEDLARVESQGIAVREKRVSVLESEIASYQAELSLAEANLEAAVIRAPDDGAVVRRIVQPGASVAVGQPVISLLVGEEIWVEAWVDEDDLDSVAVGSPATVTFKSYPDREFSGVVESLGVSTDVELPDSEVLQPRRQRMRDAPVISVRIRLDEPAADLFPGLSAVVGIRKKSG